MAITGVEKGGACPVFLIINNKLDHYEPGTKAYHGTYDGA
jgi:hypothetical protein